MSRRQSHADVELRASCTMRRAPSSPTVDETSGMALNPWLIELDG